MNERNVLVFLELNFFYGHVNEVTSFELNEYWNYQTKASLTLELAYGFLIHNKKTTVSWWFIVPFLFFLLRKLFPLQIALKGFGKECF